MAERTFSFEINRTSTAPPEVLFRLETEAPSWGQWARPLVWHASWDVEGDPVPAGVGAIRKVGLWPMLAREETLEYEPYRRHVYTLAAPPPLIRDYRAEVLFTPNESGGTDLRWQGSFTEAVPGTGPAMRALLRAMIATLATRLTHYADYK